MPRIRMGLAHLFSEKNSTLVDGLRISLGGFGVGRIPPHITLIPPTNVHSSAIEDEIFRLRSIASGFQDYELEIGPADTFHPVSPVLYLSVAGQGLSQIHSLELRLSSSENFKVSNRAYVPHVTLMDGAPEEVLNWGSTIMSNSLFVETFSSFEMLVSPVHGYWEASSDFQFVPSRKLFRGGLGVEVFSHKGGDPTIFHRAAELGLPRSLFDKSPDRRLRLSRQDHCAVSLYHNGELIGAGSSVFEAGIGLVRGVFVKKGFQRQGLGSLVIEELLYQLVLQRVEKVFAITSDEFELFVQKCGAQPCTAALELIVQENGTTLNSWSFSRR